jgi:hypothetical protein
MAKVFPEHKVCLVTNRTYSNTTAKHLSKTRGAIPYNYRVIFCHNPAISNDSDHKGNFNDFIAEIKSFLDKANNPRVRTKKFDYLNTAEKIAGYAKAYSDFFGLDWNHPYLLDNDFTSPEMEKLIAEYAENQKKIEAEKEAKKLEEAKPKIELWKKGEIHTGHLPELKKVFLRIGSMWMYTDNYRDYKQVEAIETSKGAQITLDTAKTLYKAMQRGKKITGMNVDGYTVLGWNGELLTVGCHKVEKDEINRIGALLGFEPIA